MAVEKYEPTKGPEGPERSRFASFAKNFVNVPKKEIVAKAKEWAKRKSDSP